jgi:hypothetical protein
MNLAEEVYIRLVDDKSGFVCTVKYGGVYAKATEFALNCPPTPDVLDEKALVLVRKRSQRSASSEGQ